MKKSYFFLCMLMAFGISVRSVAQEDPGITNLTHQWTFDDGTAKDIVAGADGTLMGAAVITNNALNTSAGGYLSLPASTIAINTYAEVTLETWFTSKGGNSGCKMLNYFGNTTGSYGTDYVFSTPSGCSTARTAISCGNTSAPWGAENGIDRSAGKVDDTNPHQLVVTMTSTGMTMYVDGAVVGTTTYTGSNGISALGTQFAYLCKGGYTGDPTWFGAVHKFSMYNKALTDANILYLYNKGPEQLSVINPSTTSFVFDSHYPAEQFTVSSLNLSSDVKVTAPTGITVTPSTIPANTTTTVTVIYSGSNIVNDTIRLTSGTTKVKIPVKTADDSQCFVPLYGGAYDNMITEPGVTTLSAFAGWGTRALQTILNHPENVYCGAGSMAVGNGTSTGSGSLDYTLTGALLPNTTYRVKAMVKTTDGTFQIGVWGYDSSKGDMNNVINTNGAWQALDFTFTTGPTLGTTQGMFFNNYGCSGTLGYIDNWEMYVAIDQIITTSATQFSFDKDCTGKQTFSVTAANLTTPIVVSAPAGITMSKATLPETAAADTITLAWDGTTAVNGKITLTSGEAKVEIPVKALTTSSTTCFTPLYTDRVNIVTDPYLNDLSTFGGWGAKSVIQNPDSAYCGARAGMIDGSGSIDVTLTGKLSVNTKYKARAMVKTLGGNFQMGIYGHGSAELMDTINTEGVWQQVTFEFNTGATLGASAGLYFNDWSLSGKKAYIDNWELYRVDTISAVTTVKDMFKNMYVQNNHIIAEFDAQNSTVAQIAVYTAQGAMISEEKFACVAGRNRKVVAATLPTGMYVVRMTVDGKTGYRKIVK